MGTYPVIGITCGQDISPTGVRRCCQNKSYSDAVLMAGGSPLLIPLMEDESGLRALHDRLDGLLLSGGGDVEPSRYGQAPHEKLGPTDPLRDQVELALARWALADGKPMLAICRGIQVLNVAAGGTLYQDIASLIPDALAHPYQAGNSRDFPAHPVHVRAVSLLASLLGPLDGGLWVNSMHHQAVDQVAPGFLASAWAPDGVIEAIERPGRRFALGVQWHPEEMVGNFPLMRRLFEGLVSSASRGE